MHCECSECGGLKEAAVVEKTVRRHLKKDKERLDGLDKSSPEYIHESKAITTHIIKNEILLRSMFELKRKKRRAPCVPSSKPSSDIHNDKAHFGDEMAVDIDGQMDYSEVHGTQIEEGSGAAKQPSTYEFPEDNHCTDYTVDICQSDSESILSEETEKSSQTGEGINYDMVHTYGPCIPTDADADDSSDLEENSELVFDDVDESLPDVVIKLREELRNGYTCPISPPGKDILPRSLDYHEEVSLAHYIIWWRTNSTDKGYKEYRNFIHKLTNIPIYSLHNSRALAATLVHFHVVMVDMCPMSCMAYTGPYSEFNECSHLMKKNEPCSQPRYHCTTGASSKTASSEKKKRSSRKQFAVLPVMATIRALFANKTTSREMRYRDSCLKEALDLVGKTSVVYKDFPTSSIHLAHKTRMNLFEGSRDVALALSSDGAQLTLKRQSSTWVGILILLNLPPDMRYKSNNVIINLVIPGPHTPQNLDSFIYPLFQEMARASEGIWVWDAIDSSFFVLKACITMVLGDMLGSAKLSGMAGHTAVHGDRFSLVRGAKTSEKGSKRIYYPLSPPESEIYNQGRPRYDLDKLPLRSQADYWKTIEKLENINSDTQLAQRTRLTQETGISRLSFCAASQAFRHPSFFPFDPFHLFYENCMAYIWDLWEMIASREESIRIRTIDLQRVGEWIPLAMATLPPAFCGPVRDVFQKRQSQYKIYEWMALLHWYLVPMLLELGVDYSLIDNFAQFSYIVDYSMTITERSETDLTVIHRRITSFLIEYERLYVGNDPAKVSRCHLCIFQLIHIPAHIRWNGSVRLGSQATIERTIGELSHRIRSRKAPFANLTRLVKEKELIKILQLYYPQVRALVDSSQSRKDVTTNHMFSRQPPHPKKRLLGDEANQQLRVELGAIAKWLGSPNLSLDIDDCERWGKLRLYGYVLRSALLEVPEDPLRLKRHYRWFKAQGENNFGEALAFYRIKFDGRIKELVVYNPLIEIKRCLGTSIQGTWSKDLQVTEISHLVTIVGIWRVPNTGRIYVLQKHSGLAMLMQHMPHLAEIESEEEEDENED